MSEFDLIKRLQRIVNAGQHRQLPPGTVGIGDDAAVLPLVAGQQLLVTTDTLISGVHFPHLSHASDIGFKALAVNLSDLAAMGGCADWFFLALTVPEYKQEWLDDFANGLGQIACDEGVWLSGGDTTSGPLSITITALGHVANGQALLRSGSSPGELVVLSGTTGLAGLGLSQYQAGAVVDREAWQALTRPIPRLELGAQLFGLATACIDVSDGLVADLGHILQASGVGAELKLESLPVRPCLSQLSPEDRWSLQLSAGDDYELCFTIPASREAELSRLAVATGVSLTVIGSITEQASIRLLKEDGTLLDIKSSGYDHFIGSTP